MAVLNNATYVKLAGSSIDAVYLGGEQVWSTTKGLINTLFGNGEQGVFYVPQPVVDGQQVLFTDAAGTVPVTADSDPVGRADDLTPNGNNATQVISADRSAYQTDGTLHWLAFDGVGDHMTAGNVTIRTALAVVRFTGDQSCVFAVDSGNSRYAIGYTAGKLYLVGGGITATVTSVNYTPSSTPDVISARMNGSGDCFIRVNGVQVAAGDSPAITGGFLLGRRQEASEVDYWYLTGEFSGGFVSSEAVSIEELEKAESYFAKLAGVTL